MYNYKTLLNRNKELMRCVSIMIFFMAMGWCVYVYFGHTLIEAIYEDKSLSFLNRVVLHHDMEGQRIYPLEYHLKLADQDFLCIYFVIILPSVISLYGFFVKNIALINRVSFLTISTGILIAMCTAHPIRYGDGQDYFMMTECLFNHLSPDVQNQDTQTLEEVKTKSGLNYNIFTNYSKGYDNRFYCTHFWGYSLLSLPVRFILHTFHLNELRVLQITNALLLVLALFHIVFVSKLSELQKLLFSMLAVFCPAFWFLHWTGPEIFSYSFVLISLVYMSMRKWPASIMCAAIASTQNHPLIFLVAFLWMKGMIYSNEKWKDFLILSLSAIPMVAPFAFSYLKFGIPSLLFNQEAKLRNISISKALELLFDLNIGMLPYIPIPLIISLGIMARDIVLKRKFSLSLQLFLVMLPMMVLCSSTNLWNHGTCGPNRYVIWMLPLVFYIVISEVQSIPLQTLNRRIYLSLLWIAIAIQGFIVVYGGGFIPHETYIHHTPLARFVLNHFPALYNPTTEIFIKRTRRRDELYDGIVVYYYNNKCRKALVKGKEEKQLIDLCGYIPKRYINRFRNKENEERRIYINY